LLLQRIEEWEKKCDNRWELVMDQLDELFTQVGDINTQQQMMQEADEYEYQSGGTDVEVSTTVGLTDVGYWPSSSSVDY
jgi:hypothetical protein